MKMLIQRHSPNSLCPKAVRRWVFSGCLRLPGNSPVPGARLTWVHSPSVIRGGGQRPSSTGVCPPPPVFLRGGGQWGLWASSSTGVCPPLLCFFYSALRGAVSTLDALPRKIQLSWVNHVPGFDHFSKLIFRAQIKQEYILLRGWAL